jgi:O-antigen/teichoic acid export membrane protein
VGMAVGADLALVGKDVIRILFGNGWEEAGRIFALFGPGIGVMLLYNTHGWIHLAIGRPERWLRWGLLEFGCTASLFLVTLHWGPSGIAFAWTASYFLLMFPGFWYAGKPIGLGIGLVMSSISKFFLASAVAGVATFFVFKTIPYFVAAEGIAGAFLRMTSTSVLFVSLYIVGVVVLHKGLGPLNETAGLIRELLPDRISRRKSATAGGTGTPNAECPRPEGAESRPAFTTVNDGAPAEVQGPVL